MDWDIDVSYINNKIIYMTFLWFHVIVDSGYTEILLDKQKSDEIKAHINNNMISITSVLPPVKVKLVLVLAKL